jgi:23S rRNA (guanosine2251-2'-O)-methyltransferase
MGRRPHPRSQQGQKSPFPRLYGRHAVFAALDNPERSFRKLHVTHATAKTIVIPPGLTVQYGDDHDLGRLVPADAPHQGFVLECDPLDTVWLGDILAEAQAADDKRPLIVLDQVTDPHNVGAIMRSAVAFGARALVTQDRHSPSESGALARAASGALELLPWCRVVNLARALDEIGEAGFWRIGLDGAAEADLETALAGTRPALVMGAEGEGLRALTVERCDQLAKLPIAAAMESLNVSNAAAIALYAAARRGI